MSIEATPIALARDQLGAFVSVSDDQLLHLVTWAVATRIFRQFPAFARLGLNATGKGCGKTVSMQTTLALCPEPVTVGYITTAALKGWLDEHPDSTVGIDERDNLFGTTGRSTGGRGELIATLNDGYAMDGKVMCVRQGKTVLMHVYNAMAHAGIGRPPETLADRTLSINLTKSKPESTWVSVLYTRELARTGDEIAAWLDTRVVRQAIESAPRIAGGIDPANPRRELIMAPMAAVAVAGGYYDEWREADQQIQRGITSNPMPSRGELLLATLADRVGQLVTSDDVRSLNPGQFPDGRIGDVTIAGILRSVGVESVVRDGLRGYLIPMT